jgi:sugar phosphate permease
MAMPVLFKEMSDDLDLSLVQLGMVWGIAPLAGVFVVMLGGILGDRFGAKRVLAIACFLAGIAIALIGRSGSFTTLVATMFLLGLFTAIIPAVVNKTCSLWFPAHQLGLAVSVVGTGMAVGFAVGAMISATVLSPLLGGWRNVMFLYGAISIAIGFFWLMTRSEPGYLNSSTSRTGTVPFRQAFSRVIRLRSVWLLGLILMGQMGCVRGMFGYLPLYLREIGWTAASADGTLAAFHGASIVGAIPITLLSNRLGSRKVVLLITTLMTVIGVGLLSITTGPMVLASVLMAGIVRDGFMAILLTMVMETDGVGATYSGTATGLVLTFSRIGNFASPPIGNSLASINPGLPFVFWAALAALALIVFPFVKNAGGQAKNK